MSTSGGPLPRRTKLTSLRMVPGERRAPGVGFELRHQLTAAGDPGGEVVAEPAQHEGAQRLYRAHRAWNVDLALPAFDRSYERLGAGVDREEAVQRPRQLLASEGERWQLRGEAAHQIGVDPDRMR